MKACILVCVHKHTHVLEGIIKSCSKTTNYEHRTLHNAWANNKYVYSFTVHTIHTKHLISRIATYEEQVNYMF